MTKEKALRERLLQEISGGVCAVCGSSKNLEFHEFEYPYGKTHGAAERRHRIARLLKEGRHDAVTVLCSSCHRQAHKAGKA